MLAIGLSALYYLYTFCSLEDDDDDDDDDNF